MATAPIDRARPSRLSTFIALALGFTLPASALAQDDGKDKTSDAKALETVHVTAAQIARQALGASTITASDIELHPPANDLSELLRKMPGVNLTGSSASGQYGNNRQIDLRGMGPENTLILIDGKPVGSRDSVRMGRSGERNGRGDTNWVPAEAVERIEVLRGPAAARYGSGASGGVVNIITKRPGDRLAGSVSLFDLVPRHDEEGGSKRIGFQASGPLSKTWSFRAYGSADKTAADSYELNKKYATGPNAVPPAGREGVRNRDIDALLRWDPIAGQIVEFEAGVSRQGNIYAGDRAVSTDGKAGADLFALAGKETNTMIRRTASVTHRGTYSFGTSRVTLAYEGTDNTRLNEGLAGGPEGSISADLRRSTSTLKNYTADGELNLPLTWGGIEQVLTAGFDIRQSRLDDPYSVSQGISGGQGIPGVPAVRSGRADARLTGVFVEDNMYIGDRLTLTPGLRFDHHTQFGNNTSPSVNAQYRLASDWLLKGGIARAFKAPNLYQSNPDYLYYTRGNGCPVLYPSLGSGCYILGNDRLRPETSWNKEIGVEWAPDSGWQASLTYFNNDYRNKVVAGDVPQGLTNDRRGRVFRWTNAPRATVEGFEGNLVVPLAGDRGDVLKWSSNVTYMIQNKNHETRQPLSVIPEYTVNTFLDWHPVDAWSLQLTGTFYGEQVAATRSTTSGALLPPDSLGPYHLWGASARYRMNRHLSIGFGINNLFDKRLFRKGTNNTGGGAGAATYNEPGRAYWANLTVSL